MRQYDKGATCSKSRHVIDNTDFSLKCQILHGQSQAEKTEEYVSQANNKHEAAPR